MAKVINTRIQYKHDTQDAWKDCPSISSKGELYAYVSDTGIHLKVGDAIHQVKDLPYVEFSTNNTSNINKQVISSTPEQINIPTYDGTDKEPEWSGYDQTKMTISSGSITKASQAGQYSVKFTPKEDCCWYDGSVTSKAVTWNINKANPNLQASLENIILTPKIDTITVEITTVSPGAITVALTDDDIVTVDQSGTSLTINAVNSGSTTLLIGVAKSTNYTEATISIPISCKAKLDDYSWQEIADLARAGEAHNYFQVGDIKEVFLNGEVATARDTNFTVTNENIPTYVYISNINTTSTSTKTYDTLTFAGFLQPLNDNEPTKLYAVSINDPSQDLFVGFDYALGTGTTEKTGSNWYATCLGLATAFQWQKSDGTEANAGLIDNILDTKAKKLSSYYYNSKDWFAFLNYDERDVKFKAGSSSAYTANGNAGTVYYMNNKSLSKTSCLVTGTVDFSSSLNHMPDGAGNTLYTDAKSKVIGKDSDTILHYSGIPIPESCYGGFCPFFKLGGWS